jgi:NADPH-dependent 2,4-dienoyl-CoA reductase/sulfur reductase-like enzyme
MLKVLNNATSGGNPLGIELATLRIGPREVAVFFRMPGVDRIKSLPAIRLNATDRLVEVARVTAEVWRPAPLRTKTGSTPKRPGPARKVVIPKIKAAIVPGVRR